MPNCQTVDTTAWRSMKSAPKDGTPILICETPNGEVYNVLQASYMRCGGNPLLEGWWAAGVTSRVPADLMGTFTNEEGFVTGFKELACTPLCWMPMPPREDTAKLRRRAGQIYAQKYKEMKARQ